MAVCEEKILKLRYRLISAVLFLPILIWWIYWWREWPFLFLMTAVVLIGLREYFKIVNLKGIRCHRFLGYSGAAFLPLLFKTGNLIYPSCLLAAVLMAVLISQLYRKNALSYVTQTASSTILGIIYAAWLPSHLLALKSLPDGNNLVFFVFAVTWIGDSFAYFVGSNLGKRKIWPAVSPNKTIEGTAAGILGSVLAAFLVIKVLHFLAGHYLFYLLSGLILGVMAVFGDLSESLLKRSTHIKDASSMIPGHGGVLDRFDSIFFAAPVMYYLSYFFLN